MRRIMEDNIKSVCEQSIKLEGYEFDRDNVRADYVLPQFAWMIYNMLATSLTSRNAHMTVIHNKTTLPFITSDQPVINLKYEKGKELKEFVIFYPLRPDMAIIVNDESKDRTKEIDNKNIIDNYNCKMTEHFDKYLISDKKEVLEGIRDMYLE